MEQWCGKSWGASAVKIFTHHAEVFHLSQICFIGKNKPKHEARVMKNYFQSLEKQGALQQMVRSPQSPRLSFTESVWDYIKRQQTVRNPKSTYELWQVLQSLLKTALRRNNETINQTSQASLLYNQCSFGKTTWSYIGISNRYQMPVSGVICSLNGFLSVISPMHISSRWFSLLIKQKCFYLQKPLVAR